MVNEDSIYTQLREYYFYDCKWTSKWYINWNYNLMIFEDNMGKMFIDFQYNIGDFIEEFWDYYEVH